MALSDEKAEQIMNAWGLCGWSDADRQFGQQYTCVCEHPIGVEFSAGRAGFDEDEAVRAAVALRLYLDQVAQYPLEVRRLAVEPKSSSAEAPIVSVWVARLGCSGSA